MRLRVLWILVVFCMVGRLHASTMPQYAVSSPLLTPTVGLTLWPDGVLHGRIIRGDRVIVKDLTFGNVFQDGGALGSGLKIDWTRSGQVDENYTVPAGKDTAVRNHYNYLTVNLSETNGLKRRFAVAFRVYDDGVAFWSLFPEQPALKDFVITEEQTTFVFPEDHTCWASRWDRLDNSNETDYTTTRLNSLAPTRHIQRPVTLQRNDGMRLCLYEANLTDYAGLYFRKVAGKDNALQTLLDSLRIILPDRV